MDTINILLKEHEKTVVDKKETRPQAIELARAYLVEKIKQLSFKAKIKETPSKIRPSSPS